MRTLVSKEVRTVKKLAIILAWLVETPEAYEGKTNADVEKEILKETLGVPYVKIIERIVVADVPA